MFFGVGVDPTPSLERGVVTQATDNEKARVVLVGASHMVRLAEQLDTNTISLAFQGFRPKEPNISDIVVELQKLNLNSKDTVVLDLLSNSAFMGTDSSGLPTETVKMTDGGYHVIGSLSVAPISCVKKILVACAPMAEALRNTGVVLLSPVPRYMHVKCCDDQSHVENFDDPDLEEEIGVGLEAYKRALQNWGMENELLFTVIDPTILTDSCDCPIKSRVTEDGESIWSRRDPVHMTSAAYRNLATVISDTALSVDPTDSASATGSGSAHKRRRAESVVTMPQQQQHSAKRLRGAAKLKVAGWLLGKADQPGAGRNTMGSGSGWKWRGRSSSGVRSRGGRHFAFPGRGGRGGRGGRRGW
jgi:hypothetical protein